MKNNWSNVLNFSTLEKYDDNIGIILDRFLNNYIFEEYDDNNNIIAISKLDNKNVLIKTNNRTFSLEHEMNLKDKKIKNVIHFDLKRRPIINSDGIVLENPYILKTKAKSIIIYKNSLNYEIRKERLDYYHDYYYEDNKPNIYQEMHAYTDMHYLRRDIKNKPVVPDVSVGVVGIVDYGKMICAGNIIINGKRYTDTFKLVDTNYPVSVITLNKLDDLYSGLDTDAKSKELIITKKIGFWY